MADAWVHDVSECGAKGFFAGPLFLHAVWRVMEDAVTDEGWADPMWPYMRIVFEFAWRAHLWSRDDTRGRLVVGINSADFDSYGAVWPEIAAAARASDIG
jgi:hypothetical protein